MNQGPDAATIATPVSSAAAATTTPQVQGQNNMLSDDMDALLKTDNDGNMLLEDDSSLVQTSTSTARVSSYNTNQQSNRLQNDGILSLLDIAKADFVKLGTETETQENLAAEEYDKLKKESALKKAVSKKNQEFKQMESTRLEGSLQRAKADLKSFESELSAVEKYIDELKPTCQVKGVSPEEKAAQREKTIKGLQEALTMLNSQT